MGCMCAKYIKLTGNYKAVLGRAFEIIERCAPTAADVETAKVNCYSNGSFWITFYNTENKCVAYTSEFNLDFSRGLELLLNAVRNCVNSEIWSEIYPGGGCVLNNTDKQNIIDYISSVVYDCYKLENTGSLPSWLPAPEWELGRDPARSFTSFSPGEY